MGLDMYLYTEKYESKYGNKNLSYPKELKEITLKELEKMGYKLK